MANQKNLYKNVISVTADYLGPAAERFMERQIENHLGKMPQDLKPHDLAKLISWSRLAMALLTTNNDVVDEFAERLTQLSQPSSKIQSRH